MKATPKVVLALSALLFAAGCASNKERTAVETVQSAKEQVSVTDDYITRADKTFTQFEKALDSLRKDAEADKTLRAKERFLHALSGFDNRLSGARSELADLKFANTRSWERYRTRIKEVDSDMNKSFRDSLAE